MVRIPQSRLKRNMRMFLEHLRSSRGFLTWVLEWFLKLHKGVRKSLDKIMCRGIPRALRGSSGS